MTPKEALIHFIVQHGSLLFIGFWMLCAISMILIIVNVVKLLKSKSRQMAERIDQVPTANRLSTFLFITPEQGRRLLMIILFGFVYWVSWHTAWKVGEMMTEHESVKISE